MVGAGQSQESLVLVSRVGVSAHYIAVESLDYVSGTEGVRDGICSWVHMLKNGGLTRLMCYGELFELFVGRLSGSEAARLRHRQLRLRLRQFGLGVGLDGGFALGRAEW